MFLRSAFLFLFLSLFLYSGCIRLVGKAGYYKETPEETKESVVGFDTAKIMEDKQTKGSITS
jgi:hypothetical protein